MDLDELRQTLTTELDETIAPKPALDQIIARARRRVRARRAVAAAVVVTIAGAGLAVADRTNGHAHIVVSTGTPTTTLRPVTTTTTIGLAAGERAALARIPGDNWIFGVIEKSLSSWRTVEGTEALGGDPTHQLRFAADRSGDYYVQSETNLTGTYDGLAVQVDNASRQLILRAPGDRGSTTTFPRSSDGSSSLPGEDPTNVDLVNELIMPTYVLRRTVAPLGTAVHVLGAERIVGRDAWRTEIAFPSSRYKDPWTWWVDKQTGIVLKSQAAGITTELTAVTFGRPLTGLPNPRLTAGYTIKLFLGGSDYQTVLRRDMPLAQITTDIRSGTFANANSAP